MHLSVPNSVFQPRSYMCIISTCVFLERAIHAFFPFSSSTFPTAISLASCFQNEPYMRSSVPFPTFLTAILYTFITSARVLNKSYGITRPGTSLMRPLERVERIDKATNFLMRCRFTKNKRHVISMKSIILPSCTRTTRTSRIFNFSTRTSEEYWTCLE